jgi:hypothetical protein
MQRFSRGLVGLSLVALLTCVFVIGCGGTKDSGLVGNDKDTRENKGGQTTKPSGGGGGSGQALEPVKGKGLATLKGKITIKGGDPNAVISDLTAKLHEQMKSNPDRDYCMTGSDAEKSEQVYRVGANKQVGNVAVFFQAPRGHYFPIDEKQLKDAKHPVVVDQPHCAFEPHVAVVFPFYHDDPKKPKHFAATGQELQVANSASKAHNTKYPGGNKTIPPNTPAVPVVLEEPNYREPLTFECSIHTWMRAYFWVLDHPYAAVSRSDTNQKENKVNPEDPSFGTYEIKNIPAGVKLRLFAWHEKAGFLNGANGEDIELKEGDNTKDFEIEIK